MEIVAQLRYNAVLMNTRSDLPTWRQLAAHHAEIAAVSMRDLFASQPDRFQQLSLEACGLFLDYSKNRITAETQAYLLQLARDCQVTDAIAQLFAGARVNVSENRPALHMALRAPQDYAIGGPEINTLVQDSLTKMEALTTAVRSGRYRGFTDSPITDVVNIGIGGSDLGPMMVYHTLNSKANAAEHGAIRAHFVSELDVSYIDTLLSQLNPATTLVLMVSKSFKTQETLLNAEKVRDWLVTAAGSLEAIASQFIAITAQPERARAFGVQPDRIFPMWDWVGGRFSLWSAVGLSLAITLGMDVFRELLAGAHAMDRHFAEAELAHNMPVIMALLGVWYHNFFQAQTRAVIPYSPYLKYLPDYLQQTYMESLGKSVSLQGVPIDWQTGAILWGGVGTNSQHSFHQLLMQGTHLVPIDFILPLRTLHNETQRCDELIAHCLSQSRTLMQGYHADTIQQELITQGLTAEAANRLALQKQIVGNFPSNIIMMEKLHAYSLGALIALYEHMVYVQSVVWDINAFDQWGVERGKLLAEELLDQLASQSVSANLDSSTAGLMKKIVAT